MKKCSKCGERKSFDKFHKNRSRKDGVHHACITCERERIEANNGSRRYAKYQWSAEIRGYVFALSQSEFNELRSYSCYYCGEGDIANGLDRVDNSIGYVPENVVACCGNCNRAKHALSYEDFIELVKKIYKNRIAD